jgi:hypothetical protein
MQGLARFALFRARCSDASALSVLATDIGSLSGRCATGSSPTIALEDAGELCGYSFGRGVVANRGRRARERSTREASTNRIEDPHLDCFAFLDELKYAGQVGLLQIQAGTSPNARS